MLSGYARTGNIANLAGPANPGASIGLTTVNGSSTSAMRSDAAQALSQSIVPVWTGLHTFTGGINSTGVAVNLNTGSNFNTNINTGTSTGTVSIGGNAINPSPQNSRYHYDWSRCRYRCSYRRIILCGTNTEPGLGLRCFNY